MDDLVRVGNGPETLTDLARETGASAVTVQEAAKGAGVVVVAVPFARPPPARRLPRRIAEVVHGTTESRWVERQIGHPVVKAFNGILAQRILGGSKPAGEPGRLGIAIASDGPVGQGQGGPPDRRARLR